MKIVEINSVAYGSTGKIMKNLIEKSKYNNIEIVCYVGHNHSIDSNMIRIGNRFTNLICIIFSLFGYDGKGSYFATKKLIKNIKKLNPDVIHIHNIHGFYLNYSVFFDFLRFEFSGRVIWTLHDCLAFTGKCSHFTLANCYKWKNGCFNCPQCHMYPKSYLDLSKKMWNFKKKLFTEINNMTIVTPSKWLATMVKQSFLKDYPIKIINNGVDVNIFRKYNKDETNYIFDKFNLSFNKKIILGVSSVWNVNKGLNDFIKLSNLIDNNKYQIVLVGVDSNIKQNLPEHIISIDRTDDQIELAKIYNIAFKYLNLSLEETFGLTTIESMLCGTPVIVYNKTAVAECVSKKSGYVIKDYFSRFDEILKHIDDKFFEIEIINQGKKYDCNLKYEEYIKLFNNTL